MPRLSVIVPLFNKSDYVGRALASISSQTFADFEVIVVDDGSTDRGPEIVARHRDSRVRLVSQPNRGPGAARNRGIEQSSGLLLAFLDADDEWLPHYLEASVAGMDSDGARHAAHTSAYFDEPSGADSSEMWRNRGFAPGVCQLNANTRAETLLHRVAFMSPCTTIARADVIRKLGGFYEKNCRYAEDAYLWLRVLLNYPVSFSLQPRVRVHRDASNLSATGRVFRPLEPFLASPEEVRAECPEALRPVLDQFLAIRAFKTACAWSFWGQWLAARQLLRRFRVPSPHKLPYYWLAQGAATPFGAAAGVAMRRASSIAETWVGEGAMMGRLKRVLFYGIRLIGGFAIAQRITRTRLRILCYHGFSIADEHELAPYVFMRLETFARRMHILHKRGLTVVSLDEALDRLRADAITSCETVITFDDGWASNLLVMPILERYRFPACIYITTEHLNAGGVEAFNVILTQMVQRSRVASLVLRDIHPQIDGEYNVARDAAAAAALLVTAAGRIGTLQERQRLLAPLAAALCLDYSSFVAGGRFLFLSKEQITALAKTGISIQLHTHTHHLPSTNFDEMADEIRQNRTAITELTGITPKHFCYPSGEHSPWHPEWLARSGVASATTCDSGFNGSDTSLLLLKRYLDSEHTSDIEFEAEVTGVRELLRRMRSALNRVVCR